MTSKNPTPDGPGEAKSVADLLRSGEAPLVIRRKGARGELPLNLSAKLEVLAILTGDPDGEIRKEALQTLRNWTSSEIRQALADPETPPIVLEWAARNLAEGHFLDELLQNPALSPGAESLILARITASDGSEATEAAPEEAAQPAEPAGDALFAGRETVQQKLGRMTVAQKLKRAITGSQEERLILIRDANKIVARAVLQSPKLTEAEIEAYASMRNVAEEVLRLIGTNRAFLKNYSVLRALMNNPRAPLDIMLPMISRLNERDIKSLATNKNVSDALRTTAAKMLMSRESSRTSSFSRKH